jgi:hypothetical protein
MVELACSTTLAAAYYPKLLNYILPDQEKSAPLVFIICGGISISAAELIEYESLLQDEGSHEVWIDGRTYVV